MRVVMIAISLIVLAFSANAGPTDDGAAQSLKNEHTINGVIELPNNNCDNYEQLAEDKSPNSQYAQRKPNCCGNCSAGGRDGCWIQVDSEGGYCSAC